jgi:hypothetical protein
LGWVNGSPHVLVEGVGPIGALAGAAIAEGSRSGSRPAARFAGLGFLVLSPLRGLRAVASP